MSLFSFLPRTGDAADGTDRTYWRVFWVVVASTALIMGLILSVVLYPWLSAPAVQITPVLDRPLSGCPGEVVPFTYHIRIAYAPTRAEITETWWNAEQRKTLIDSELRYRPLPQKVDRDVSDEAVRIPTEYLDPQTQDMVPMKPGRWEFRRSALARNGIGVEKESIMVLPIEVKDC